MKKTILLGILLMVLPLVSATTGNFDDTANTLLLHDFNNSLVANNDESFGLSLAAGSNTFGVDQLDQTDEAIYFNTSNWYATNTTVNLIDNGDNNTFEMVFKCTNTANTENLIIGDAGTQTAGYQIASNQSLRFFIRDSTGAIDNYYTPTVFDDDTWHYAAYVRDQLSVTGQLYIDGSLLYNQSLTADGQVHFSTGFYVGSGSSGSNLAEVCTISTFRITDSYLTSSEISAINTSLFVVVTPDSTLPDLQLYYRMENSNMDMLNYVNISDRALTPYTIYDYPTRKAGLLNYGQYFDDVNDALVSNNTIYSSYLDNFTINFWYQKNSTSGSPITYMQDGTGFVKIQFTPTGGLRFQDTLNGNAGGIKTSDVINISDKINDDTWHMVTFIYNITGSAGSTYNTQVYVDGALELYDIETNTFSYTKNKSFWVGNTIGSDFYGGLIDEIGFWNITLDNSTISLLYNSGIGLDPTTISSLLVNFEDGFYGTNLTGYNITATISNGVYSESQTTLNGTVHFINLFNDTFNVSAVINNASEYSPSTLLNFELSGDDSTSLYFYNETYVNISFIDVFDDPILDNVSFDLIDSVTYQSFTINGTGSLRTQFGTYDIRAEVLNNSVYNDNIYYSQDLTNDSTVSGVVPTFYLDFVFFNSSSDGAANITLTVYDQIGRVVEGATVHIQRFDVDTNSYLTVAVIDTNSQGRVRFGANLYDELYKFLIFYGGELKKSTNPEQIDSTELRIVIDLIGDVQENFNSLVDLNYQFYITDSGLVTMNLNYFGLVSPISQVCLKVYSVEVISGRTLTNNTCSSSTSGTLLVNLVNVSGRTYEGDAVVYFVDDSTSVFDQVYYKFREANDYGILGILLTIILVFSVALLYRFALELPLIMIPLVLILTGDSIGKLNPIPLYISVPLMIMGVVLAIWIHTKR